MILESQNIISDKLKLKSTILQFLPANLQEKIEGKEIIILDTKRLKVSFLVDIVHNILLKYFLTTKNGVGDNSFNLSSTILREKYGNDYSVYLKWLSDNQIIELFSDYMVGKKARTYKLTDTTLASSINRYKNTNSRILNRYKDNVLSSQVAQSNNGWIKQNIKQKLVQDLFSVKIDSIKAKEIINSYRSDSDSYNRNMYSIECIHDGHIFFNFDNYGRMHTNFTILKSRIRKECLLIDDEAVSEIDIKNSQPLFLTLLLSKNLDKIKDKSEFFFFKKSVIEGNLYKYFMDECNVGNKKKVKELIYKVLFGRNSNDYENQIFKKLFPSIYSFIKWYKRENNDYRALAYYLQRSESNLLFNNIINRIIQSEPDIKLFTIHDSICFNYRYKSKVESIFYDEINKLFSDNEK